MTQISTPPLLSKQLCHLRLKLQWPLRSILRSRTGREVGTGLRNLLKEVTWGQVNLELSFKQTCHVMCHRFHIHVVYIYIYINMWNIFETKWFHTMSCHLRNCEKAQTFSPNGRGGSSGILPQNLAWDWLPKRLSYWKWHTTSYYHILHLGNFR